MKMENVSVFMFMLMFYIDATNIHNSSRNRHDTTTLYRNSQLIQQAKREFWLYSRKR